MNIRLAPLGALLTLLACGGSVSPAPTPDDAGDGAALDGGPVPDASPDAAPDAPDADCWRCADKAWRNVCVVPAERGTDAESCLHCGEHCVSDPPDGG